jgi:phage FluMu protein Com
MKPATTRDYIEIRCNKDNTLLFRARHVGSGEIEIKCRRCGEQRIITFPREKERDGQTGIPMLLQKKHRGPVRLREKVDHESR